MTIYIYNQDFLFFGKLRSQIKRLFGIRNAGPDAVFASAIRGLKNLGQDFKVNQKFSGIAEVVCVLSGAGVLKWAIQKKAEGKIKLLFAGPNVVQTPNDYNGLLANPLVDACLVPSKQVKIAYERYNPKLLGRIFVWYTGVNEMFWVPSANGAQMQNILLYCKNSSKELVLEAQNIVKASGYKPIVINYGQYSQSEFKSALQQCQAAIFFSQSESQGIALAESWSLNVPTLVWNPKKPHPHFKDMTDSPAPFLSESTGKFWENLDELRQLVEGLTKINFHPRQWVLENMTDSKSAQVLLNLLNQLKNKI